MPQQDCTTMFSLIPQNVTSERTIALLLATIRWCQELRAPEVTIWQQRHRVGWDATDGRKGGAERIVCGKRDCRAGEGDQEAITLAKNVEEDIVKCDVDTRRHLCFMLRVLFSNQLLYLRGCLERWLQNIEEDMPRQEEESVLEKSARSYNAKTGVVCDGFHPKSPLGLTRETIGEVVEFVEKGEQCGRLPQHACTTMFCLIPKDVTSLASHCAYVYDGLLVGSLAIARGCEMATKNRSERDAADERNGGAERMAQEIYERQLWSWTL